jgi:hypothetical protein
VRSDDGIIYSCSGESYVAEAIRSARSSLRHNPLPHVVFASPAPADFNAQSGLSVQPFEASADPFLDKIRNIRRSPFERTIFLDTDTFIVDELVQLLHLLERYDMAVAHTAGYRGFADPEVPAAFYELNTGVMAWRSNERTAAFLADWEETYVAWAREEPFHSAATSDQAAFRRCAWMHELRLLILGPEYNFRTLFPATVVDRVRVVHGRRRNSEGLAARLNSRHGPRNFTPLRARLASRPVTRKILRRVERRSTRRRQVPAQ